jgi:hypothetical protein
VKVLALAAVASPHSRIPMSDLTDTFMTPLTDR